MLAYSCGGWGDTSGGLEKSEDGSFWLSEASALWSQGKVASRRTYRPWALAGGTETSLSWDTLAMMEGASGAQLLNQVLVS